MSTGDNASMIEEWRGIARVAMTKGDVQLLKDANDALAELGDRPEVGPVAPPESGTPPEATPPAPTPPPVDPPAAAKPAPKAAGGSLFGKVKDFAQAMGGGAQDQASLGMMSAEGGGLATAEAGWADAFRAVQQNPGDESAARRLKYWEELMAGQRDASYAMSRNPAGSALGMMAMAPFGIGGHVTNAAGKGIAAAGRALPELARRFLPAARSMGGRVVNAGAAGGVGAGTESGARTALAGGSAEEVADSFVEGAKMGGLASGLGMHLNLRLRNPRTLTGEYIEGMDYGKQSGLFDSAEYRGPAYWDDPVTTPKGLPEGFRGVGVAARQGSNKALSLTDEAYNQLNKDWEAGIDHPGRHLPDDVSQFVGDMDNAVVRYKSSGRAVDTGVEAAVKDAKKNLGTRREVFVEDPEVVEAVPYVEPTPAPPVTTKAMVRAGAIPVETGRFSREFHGPAADSVAAAPANTKTRAPRRGARKGESQTVAAQPEEAPPTDYTAPDAPPPSAPTKGPPETALKSAGVKTLPIATLDDLTKQKQAWKESAELGQRPTKDNRPYRKLWRSAVAATKRIAEEHPNPQIREAAQRQLAADQAFAQGAGVLEEVHSRLFGKKKAALENDVKNQRRGANELLQVAKNTQASGIRFDDFEKLRALGGPYEDIVKRMMATVADAATTPSLTPGTFAHSAAWMQGVPEQLAQALKVRLAEPLTRGFAGEGADLPLPGRRPGARMLAAPLRDPLESVLAARREEERKGRK